MEIWVLLIDVKAKVKDKYRRHILVKAPVDAQVGEILSECAASLDKEWVST